MENLKRLKEELTMTVQSQMGNLSNANAQELGAAIDMIKDLSEAIYYCSIVKAMEDSDEDRKIMDKINSKQQMYGGYNYYSRPYYRMEPGMESYRRDREYGRMYYNGGSGASGDSSGNGNSGRNNSSSNSGRSSETRRYYMNGKETHQPKEKQVQELNRYMQDLASDLTEMIQDASQEEKILLQQKLSDLSAKIK